MTYLAAITWKGSNGLMCGVTVYELMFKNIRSLKRNLNGKKMLYYNCKAECLDIHSALMSIKRYQTFIADSPGAALTTSWSFLNSVSGVSYWWRSCRTLEVLVHQVPSWFMTYWIKIEIFSSNSSGQRSAWINHNFFDTSRRQQLMPSLLSSRLRWTWRRLMRNNMNNRQWSSLKA